MAYVNKALCPTQVTCPPKLGCGSAPVIFKSQANETASTWDNVSFVAEERKRWQTTQWLKILLRNYAYHFSISTGPRSISIHAPSAFWIIKARNDSQNAENQIGMYLHLVTNCFPREMDRKNYCHQNKGVAILVHLLCCHFLSKVQSVF